MSETIPGGYYIGTDGQAHDAHGNVLPPPIDSAVETGPIGPVSAPISEPTPAPLVTRKAKRG